jgi:hypothetical protein
MLTDSQCEPQIDLEDFDKLVCAEMPRADNGGDEELRNLIRRYNLHPEDHLDLGPNPKKPKYSRCRTSDNLCSYRYPHPNRPRTTVDNQGKVLYRRRQAEDAWVVPYNPAIARFWQGHSNLEIACSADVFYYLYKYMYKGVDKAKVALLHQSESPDILARDLTL